MSDTNLEQTDPTPPSSSEATQHGELYIMEDSEGISAVAPAPTANVTPVPVATQQQSNRSATIEHLAARQTVPPLKVDAPEVKQFLRDLRAEATVLVTGLRWDGVPAKETVERIIPLLNIGPLQQWIPLVIPTLLEIDRAGNLVPVWLKVIEQEEPDDLQPNENPAETPIGRARRYAIQMLGYYKAPEISKVLGQLALDPNSSLYATRALVKQATVPAMQALTTALKEAEGWAKVDVIDAYGLLNLARFHEILIASGLDSANGLESYIAAPLYRSIPLERYLAEGKGVAPRLSQQAALIFNQVLQDSINMLNANAVSLPIVFEADLPKRASALFEGARHEPGWQKVVALHRLALLLGLYWSNIAHGAIQDTRILKSIYACLPMMPEVERWMNGTGHEVLRQAAAQPESEGFASSSKVLAEIRQASVNETRSRS